MAQSTYQLLKSLLQPARSADKTYDELVQTLSNHFTFAPSVIVQRFKFKTRISKSGKSLLQWCNVSKYKNLNRYHVIYVVTFISQVLVVLDGRNIVIVALQRFVGVQQRRYSIKEDLKRPNHTFRITRLTPF